MGWAIAGTSISGFEGSSRDISVEFVSLLVNNATVYLLMVLGSITFAVTSFFLLFNTGLLVGAIVHSGLTNGSSLIDVVLLIGTHGILELPAFLLGSAIGIRVTRELIAYLRGKQEEVLTSEELREYAVLAAFGLLLIVVAAYIEADVTPRLYELLR